MRPPVKASILCTLTESYRAACGIINDYLTELKKKKKQLILFSFHITDCDLFFFKPKCDTNIKTKLRILIFFLHLYSSAFCLIFLKDEVAEILLLSPSQISL